MSIPARPRFQVQSPAISGDPLGWLSCTAYATAMAIDRSTLGALRPTGADVRRLTGDTTGGLSLPQMVGPAAHYGVALEVRSGASAATHDWLRAQLLAGRGIVLQGNTSALLDTAFRSTSGAINHAVYVNELRADGLALVMDPCADGRRAEIDQGPSWWPWKTVLDFAAALRPYGDRDPDVVGPDRIYCAAGPDTEPHVHLAHGGRRTAPFPDRVNAWNANPKRRVNVRRAPSLSAPVVGRLAVGQPFTVWQVAQGASVAGSKVWYGDHDGRRWVHSSGLRGVGGQA